VLLRLSLSHQEGRSFGGIHRGCLIRSFSGTRMGV